MSRIAHTVRTPKPAVGGNFSHSMQGTVFMQINYQQRTAEEANAYVAGCVTAIVSQ